MSSFTEQEKPLEETPSDKNGLLGRVKQTITGGGLATVYGLLAVLTVAVVEFFFSLDDGGFYVLQWYRGAIAISVLLVLSTLVPGYFTNARIGRKQWLLVGALAVLLGVSGASMLWSLSRELSFLDTSRTTMYVGVFVLLLPAVARWGWLTIDTIVFAGLLPPALYGLLQKIFPTIMEYTGFISLDRDPRASSTIGYHPTFGMMCAMGALLIVSRISSLRATSLRMTPLRALYAAVGTIFLVAMFFSFSRGAVAALAGGAVVLLVLSKNRFETLGNALTSGLPALWVISQARDVPGLVSRPVDRAVMASGGWDLVGPLFQAFLLAFVAQAAFTLVVWVVETRVPGSVRRVAGAVATIVAAGVVVVGLGWGWAAFQGSDGMEKLRNDFFSTQQTAGSESLDEDLTQRYATLNTSGRIVLWQIAWENWQQHPLTGTGGDTYRIVYQQEKAEDAQEVLHPHSLWMTLLSDKGIFAFLAFAAFSLGLLALAAYNALYRKRSVRSRAIIAGSSAAVTAYLISSSIDWNWYIPAATIPFFALAAVMAGMTPRRRKRSESLIRSTE